MKLILRLTCGGEKTIFITTRETWVQSQVESYQRLKKWYLMPPYLTFCIIRYESMIKWSNPRNGVAPSPTPRCIEKEAFGSLSTTVTKFTYVYIYPLYFILFSFADISHNYLTSFFLFFHFFLQLFFLSSFFSFFLSPFSFCGSFTCSILRIQILIRNAINLEGANNY